MLAGNRTSRLSAGKKDTGARAISRVLQGLMVFQVFLGFSGVFLGGSCFGMFC